MSMISASRCTSPCSSPAEITDFSVGNIILVVSHSSDEWILLARKTSFAYLLELFSSYLTEILELNRLYTQIMKNLFILNRTNQNS